VLRELLDHPEVTEEVQLGSSVGVMAIHGGIEADTAEMAREIVQATGASLYVIEQSEQLAWHLPSTEYDPSHSEALTSFIDHVDRVVSLHGFGRDHLRGAVLVGGTNQLMRSSVAHLLRMRTRLRVVDRMRDIPRNLRGQHPQNPVNLPRHGGVQLELSATARVAPHRGMVVEAVADAITETQA
jgi:phage replication-related protein YjqB (UPF0714/DUF867 family)